MSEQRLPRADGDFSVYANHYFGAVEKFYDDQGLDPALLADLKKAVNDWNAAYPAHVSARAAAHAAAQVKDDAKRELERQIRPVTAFVQSWHGTTDADRAAIGITIKDTARRVVPPPTARPVLLVESGSRLTHRLRVLDEGGGHGSESRATRSRRPRGTLGAEVYVAVLAPRESPPADFTRYRFVRTVTGGAAEVSFEAGQGGGGAAYLVRWVSATGEPGPWGETVVATIAA